MAATRRRPSRYPMPQEDAYRRVLQRRAQLIGTMLIEQALPLIEDAKEREALLRMDALSPEEDARLSAVLGPEPIWYADGNLVAVSPAEMDLGSYRADADARFVADLLALVERMRGAVVQAFPFDPARVMPFARGVDTKVSKTLARDLGRSVVRDESTARHLRLWAGQNADRVTGFSQQMLDDIARGTVKAVREGLPASDLAKVLRQRLGMSKRRAAYIARDQIGSLNGQITKARQVAAGISRYRWSDSGDSRVRPLHEEMNGNVYSWATGAPEEGGQNPGEPHACRCVALPER